METECFRKQMPEKPRQTDRACSNSDNAQATMEKDPDVVARLAEAKRDENWRLRTYLKRSPTLRSGRVDRLAEQAGHQAEAEIDCTTCGACCRDICIPVTDVELARISLCLVIEP